MVKKIFLLSACFLLATFLSGCATIYNPATGKRETYFINTAQEMAIGQNVAKEVLNKNKILPEESTQDYVRSIGSKIAAVSDRQDIEYSFTVLDSKELNAFALPGGAVYVNKGLIDILEENEIAAALAHEVGHIAARHAVKRIQGQMGYQLLMAVASYEASKKDARLAKSVSAGAGSIFQMVLLGYSRQDEILADRLAIKYTRKAGYDPRGMLDVLKKLNERSKEKGLWRPLVVLRSHPYLEDRIRLAEAQVSAAQ